MAIVLEKSETRTEREGSGCTPCATFEVTDKFVEEHAGVKMCFGTVRIRDKHGFVVAVKYHEIIWEDEKVGGEMRRIHYYSDAQ